MIGTLLTVGFLVGLEVLLSIDNALVLAALTSKLPAEQRRKALTYGVWGAMGFRAVCLLGLTWLLALPTVKILGAFYLLWLAAGHFMFPAVEDVPEEGRSDRFWKIVLAVELTDVAFSSDSILASVAVTDQYWVLLVGGVAGIAAMRFVSSLLVRVIGAFPRLETTAYALVGIVALKLLAQGWGFALTEFPWSHLYPVAVVAAIGYGFTSRREPGT